MPKLNSTGNGTTKTAVPGSNRVNWSEFEGSCHKLRFHGDVAGAWRAFDVDLSGYLTLNEVDTEASDAWNVWKKGTKKNRAVK